MELYGRLARHEVPSRRLPRLTVDSGHAWKPLLRGASCFIMSLEILNPRRVLVLYGLAMLLVVWFAYEPSFSGSFFFDDEANIRQNRHLQVGEGGPLALWEATMSGDSGPLKRPVAMLTFALNIYAAGLDPHAMRLTNLAIHLVTGFALLALTHMFAGHLWPRRGYAGPLWLAGFAATLWLVHPFNLTGVAYIVQRMTSLSALFTVLTLLTYTHLRVRQQAMRGGWATHLIAMTFTSSLGLLSKENAALVPIYIAAIELTVFRFSARERSDQIKARIFFWACILIPASLLLIILAFTPDLLIAGYQHRPFTLSERLLTEMRIIAWYIRMLLIPDLSQMGLFLDDFAVSRSLVDSWTTLLAMVAILALIAAALANIRRRPLFALGVLWYFAGHLMESTIIPLELAYEHRNYLPGFGILLAVTSLTCELIGHYRLKKPQTALLALVPVLTLTLLTHVRAGDWRSKLDLILAEVRHHPESPRANIAAGHAYSALATRATTVHRRQAVFAESVHHFDIAAAMAPSSPNPLFGKLFSYAQQDQSPPPSLLQELTAKSATGFVDATTSNAVYQLAQCQVADKCHIPEQALLGIAVGIYSNPSGDNLIQANTLRALALYYGEQTRNYPRAIDLTREAIQHVPNRVHVRFELVRYLAMAGLFGQAKNELQRIDEMDRWQTLAHLSNQWRQTLEDASTRDARRPTE